MTVEYVITPLGESFISVLAAIRDWAEANVAEIVAARERVSSTGEAAIGATT